MNNKRTPEINLPDRRNFAPLKPFQTLRDESISEAEAEKRAVDDDLAKQFRNKYDELKGLNKQPWRSIILAGEINGLFIQGEQVIKINSYTGQPRIDTPNRRDPMQIKAINKLQMYCTQMQAKWKSSKPDILVEARSTADEAVAQARKANAVIDHLEREFFNPWFDLQEGLDAQIWGWYGRQVMTDFSDRSLKTIRKVLGEKEITIGKNYGRCEECGYRGEEVGEKEVEGGAKFDCCPKCESLEYEFEPAAKSLIKAEVGEEECFLPTIKMRSIKLPGTRWDMTKRLEESSWALMERWVDEGVLREMLGCVRFPEGDDSDDFGLEVLDRIAKRGAEIGGETSKTVDKGNRVKLTEMYLSASDLWDIRIPKNCVTVEGETLPAGKRGSEVWPDGVTVFGVQGLALMLGLGSGTHHDKVASGVYHMKPDSGLGRGIDDSIEIQKQFNRMFSQISENIQSRGTPAMLVAENAIDERYRRLLGTPKAVIPVKMQNHPEIKSLDALVKPLQGQQVPGDMLNVTFSALENLLQTAYHIMNFAGGNPRANNKTATGAEILDANADEIVGPLLAIKAECNLNTVRNGFKMWAKNTPEPCFIRYKDKDGSARGQEICGPEVDAEYDWSWTQGSEAPKTRFTENQKRMNFFALFGGIQNYMMARAQAPDLVREIERDFDVNFESQSYDAVAMSCRLRLTNARRILEMMTVVSEATSAVTGVEMPPDMMAVMSQVQPSMLPTEERLAEKASWFQKLLDSEEGLEMAAEERALVSAFIESFHELQKAQAAKIQTDAAEVQNAAAAPAMEAQAAAQAAQGQEAAAQEQAKTEAATAAQREQQLAAEQSDNRKQEADDRRQAADHAMRLAEMKHEQELTAAQLAAKAKTEGGGAEFTH